MPVRLPILYPIRGPPVNSSECIDGYISRIYLGYTHYIRILPQYPPHMDLISLHCAIIVLKVEGIMRSAALSCGAWTDIIAVYLTGRGRQVFVPSADL